MGVRGTEGAPQNLTNQTVRNVVFPRAGGDQLRIRLSNHFGDRPVQVGAVSVAVAGPGGSVVESTRRTVTFDGAGSVSLLLQRTTTSDPIALSVPPATRLAVSIHLPGATGAPTWHRYPDFLARRLHLLEYGRRMTVSNAGIAGAMPADRAATVNIQGGTQRFGRDVPEVEGVRGLVVLLGTNDLGKTAVTASSFTSQLCAVVQRARRTGINVVLGTIPPSGGSSDDPRRVAINDWIRRSVEARISDGVADFDAVLRVSETDSRIRPSLLAEGDTYAVHPDSAGYEAMAAVVPLAVLNRDKTPFEVSCA